jgi:hypothetical protein
MEQDEVASVDITLYRTVNVLVDWDHGGISYFCALATVHPLVILPFSSQWKIPELLLR